MGTSVLGVILLCAWTVSGVPLRLFYPFGSDARDYVLLQGDDTSSNEFPLNTSIAYLNNRFKNIYINNNGHLSFDTELPDYRPTLILPIGFNIIAAYLADVDTRTSGKVYYRETSERALLDRAGADIQAHFRGQSRFEPRSLFVATWDGVGYYNGKSDKTATFQIVLASDGTDSFAFFFYLDEGMQWIMGEGKLSPVQVDVPAQAGFDSEDGRHLKLPDSGKSAIFVRDTNVNIPGAWMFHIGNTGDEDVQPADLNTGEVIVFPVESGAASCLEGAQRCHINATCHDYTEGFCCKCLPGNYGNGKTCLVPGVHQRMNGKVRGQINGYQLEDVDMHTYVVTSDGRAHSVVGRVPAELGSSMQTLSAIGSIIGWLFAVRTNDQSKNGYTYTGGEFNRTAVLSFAYQNRSYVLNIDQQFHGHNALNNLRMETQVRGEIPQIPAGTKVTVVPHKQNIRRVRPGVVKMRSSFLYRVDNIAYRYTLDETVMFHECMADPSTSVSETMRLSVHRNFVYYDAATRHVRYDQSSKIAILTGDIDDIDEKLDSGEDPCRDAATNCAAEADCVSEGDSYKCLCRIGYQGDGATCSDVDECRTGANACSENARCLNVVGSFQCQCLPGFRGDGLICRREVQLCGDRQCGDHARCVFDGQRPVCECNPGFSGDGVDCRPDFSCNEVDNCGPNAECVYDDVDGRYFCECTDGFSGDGFSCETTDERSVCQRCDRNAACVMDVDRFTYRCQCNVGYTGDGYRCTAIDPCLECSTNADCSFEQTSQQYVCRCHPGYYGDGRRCDAYDCQVHSICDANAQCVADPNSGNNICRCNVGYRGDGRRCILDQCRADSDCDPNAQCLAGADGNYVCRCNNGFRGDGRRCVMDGCRTDEDCGQFARCSPDPRDTSRFICRCQPGYEGDGRVCIQRVVPCNQVNNCAREAECIYDPDAQSYRCQCRPEYEGDGFTCRRRSDEPDCYRDPRLCDPNASCIQNVDHYVCVCNMNYVGDGQSCRPYDSSRNYLIYAQGYSISRIGYADSATRGQMLVYIPGQLAVGVATDCAEGYLYWTDVAGGKVMRSLLNGTMQETVIRGLVSPEGIAIDHVSRNLYYTDSELDVIGVAKLDGSSKKTLFSGDIVNPRSIVIDPRRGVFYWTDWNREKPQIEKANMDGSERQVLVSEDLGLPNGLTLDERTQQLCWGDAGTKRVECMRSDGLGRRIIYDKAPYPFDLTYFNNQIYWSDWDTKGVPSISRQGASESNAALNLAIGGTGKLYGITAVMDHCPRVSNACVANNGGCAYLCLPTPYGGRSCACPDNIDPRRCNEVKRK